MPRGFDSIVISIILLSRELAALLNESFPEVAMMRSRGVENNPSKTGLSHKDVALNEAVCQVKTELENHKIRVDQSRIDQSNKEKDLRKAQNDVEIQERSILVCKREIDHHCCQCGGIHVFMDHKPVQREGCKRLKNKFRSLMYLKEGLKEAKVRMNICESALNDVSALRYCAQTNMTSSLSDGISLIGSIVNNTKSPKTLGTFSSPG